MSESFVTNVNTVKERLISGFGTGVLCGAGFIAWGGGINLHFPLGWPHDPGKEGKGGGKDVRLWSELSQWEPHAGKREKKQREERRRGQSVTKASLWNQTECRVDLSSKAERLKKECQRLWIRFHGIPNFQEYQTRRRKNNVKCNLETKLQQARLAEPPEVRTFASNHLRLADGISGVMMGVCFVFFVLLQLLC